MKKRVLIVDDEWAILELLKFRLFRRGFEVSTAQNAEEFEEEVARQKPDLILLDIWLGGKIGTDVYSHLLEKGLDANIPVIFMTALIGEEAPPKRACRGGKYALYGKPFDFEKMMKDVRQLLAFAQARVADAIRPLGAVEFACD